MRRGRTGSRRDASPGLDELMIVNPRAPGRSTGLLLGEDGGVYRVRIAGIAGGWFVGDDGSLYEAAAAPPVRRPRHFLGADGGLYAAEWAGSEVGGGLDCGCRGSCRTWARNR